jgi:hypothetical protein
MLPLPTDRPLRILLGTCEIAGLLPIVADAFRANGHHVTTVVKVRNEWWPDTYDYDYSNRATTALDAIEFGNLVAQQDVLYFQWARHSFVDDLSDLPLYRKLGKRIIYTALGCDIRAGAAFSQLYEQHGLTLADGFELMPLDATMHAHRMLELFADVVYAQPNFASLAIRPYHHASVPVQLARYAPFVAGRDVPLVVHAPSSRGRKGSHVILAALDQLQTEGVRFDLQLIENVPHTELLNIFSGADVVIDQTNNAMHGRTTVDAWASGCAVATSDAPAIEPLPAPRPLCRISPDLRATTEQLRTLLTQRETRVQLAHDGLAYVQQWHDHVKFGARALQHLADPAGTVEHHPEFFTRHFTAPANEPVPDYLKQLTAAVLEQHGMPADIDPRALAARGLLLPRDVARVAAAQRRRHSAPTSVMTRVA